MVKKRKQYFNLKRTLLLKKLVAFLLIITFAAACGEGIPHETDMRTIQLEFVDQTTQSKPLRMDIPFAYLRQPWWRLIAKKKPQPFIITDGKQIEIKTIFPELTPHPQSFGVTGKYKQGLFISVIGADALDKYYQESLARYKKKYALISTNFFGFNRYELPCASSRCIGDDRDYISSGLELEDHKIIGRCYKPDRNPGGGCVFSTSFRGKSISYTFRRTELERWREIDAHVRRLLESFFVE